MPGGAIILIQTRWHEEDLAGWLLKGHENWVTLNEPMLLCTMSYWQGRWPPQKKGFMKFERALGHFALAHRRAYRAIHRVQPSAKVGIAKHMISYKPVKNVWHHVLASKILDWWFNHRFLKMTRLKHDFIGVNYYFQREVLIYHEWYFYVF